MDKILQELIAIPSVCSDHAAAETAIEYVQAKLETLPLHIKRYRNHGYPALVATTRNTTKPKVMLYAHLDVVDAPPELFSLRLENGIYYGRGVLDMKVAVAAYLHVLEDMRHVLPDYDLGVMFTTDEEYFGIYGAGFLVEQKGYLPQVCLLPDSAFGTNWQIETFAKGCWFVEITALGISAHGSRPWEGDSASVKLVQALHEINNLFDGLQQPDTATLNIGLMQGGSSINQIPPSASASLDIRFCDMETYHRLHNSIQAICDRFGVVMRTTREANEPTISDINHPLITAFTKLVYAQTGVQPLPFRTYGTTDARFFRAHDVPCILMSPPGKYAHSDEEQLSEAGYEDFKCIIRAYLEEVAKSPLRAHESITEALTITS